jgi:thiopurine S-methyltransferase
MDPSFWHERWQSHNTPWHQSEVHPFLAAHIDGLARPGARIFVPLCGKTLDIRWLLGQGYRVAGAELSELAIKELFAELGVEPRISQAGPLLVYQADRIDIFVGDIFALTAEALGPVDAVYDRAAIVALPPAVRERYTAHLSAITARAPQLLISFDYDQAVMDGPPFSVSAAEIREHYAPRFAIEARQTRDVPGGLRGGQTPATETLYVLTPTFTR